MNGKMTLERQLKLQAYLDGELPEREQRVVAGWLEREPELRALLAELRSSRDALSGNEPVVSLPESREFYWSKIEREILRAEREPRLARGLGVLAWLRRMLVPAAGLAMVVLAGTVLLWPGRAHPGDGAFELSVTEDSGATTYRDHANGVTLVWLSYPATEREIDYETPPPENR